MINMTVRVRNRQFWMALVPALVVLAQAVLAPLGISWDFEGWGAYLMCAIDALFAVLAVLGIVVDPTTEGVWDSAQALTYTEPKPKHYEA